MNATIGEVLGTRGCALDLFMMMDGMAVFNAHRGQGNDELGWFYLSAEFAADRLDRSVECIKRHLRKFTKAGILTPKIGQDSRGYSKLGFELARTDSALSRGRTVVEPSLNRRSTVASLSLYKSKEESKSQQELKSVPVHPHM